MSDWITISPTDVYDYLAAEQAVALQSEALGDDQTDPTATIIADVTARVRAEVSGNSSNTLGAASATIPPELRGAAMALIVEAAQARIPTLTMTADQIRLANAARALLKRVADGDVPVTQGVTTTDAGSSVAKVVLVKSRKTFVTGASLNGL